MSTHTLTHATGGERPPATLRPHPKANLVPRMAREHYLAFRDDIDARGIRVPLEITPGGTILDGRERHNAATDLELEHVPVHVIEPADEVEHIILAALQRRQLTASQRAALAIELDAYRDLTHRAKQRSRNNLRQHRPAEVATLPPRGKTRDLAAAWAGVSARTIQDATTVHQHDPDLFEQVKAGRIAADAAARKVRRQLRDAAIEPAPAIPTGPFQLIYADPPWQLGNPDSQYAPENHYPTMPLDQIAALEIPAADDAILVLWAVNSLLPQALQVLEAWGFTYKTNLAWVKPSIGVGNWVRNRHELLLLATRGKPPLAEPDQRPDSVIHAPRGRHSQKPEEAYELIEAGWPHLTRVELFARQARPGWAAWGNQLAV